MNIARWGFEAGGRVRSAAHRLVKYCQDITQEGLSNISLGREQAANTAMPLAFSDFSKRSESRKRPIHDSNPFRYKFSSGFVGYVIS